ncbi:MAG: tRNA epoxyqueuosine(34) reductase QueG [Leptolyngbyaceae cyanobacterium bins.349]|nr:tRNA epoxyqueuosine(34) reductase QueG [Leptolyngbyaceae cyanobacterium bins.349]
MDSQDISLWLQRLADQVKQQALALGFHQVGIARVQAQPDDAIAHLQDWLKQGLHADMAWMTNPKRQDIFQVMPEVKTVICVALNYYAPVAHSPDPAHGKISRYGWGRDYHKVLHKRLKALAQWLQAQGDEIQARYYADTGPVQDKVWAQQAGLGWIAKNGNLITRKYGSWVFLGEVLTNLELPSDRPHTSHCGTCTRCLEACPTGAILRPHVVDANRCIAYHTIENRAEELPTAIAANLQGWVAGCDICQDVCPWNQRFAQPTNVPEFSPQPWNIAPRLSELATLTEAEYEQRFTGSALRRIKPWMIRRNAQANLPHPAAHAPAAVEAESNETI